MGEIHTNKIKKVEKEKKMIILKCLDINEIIV